jgi:hypothetical protein
VLRSTGARAWLITLARLLIAILAGLLFTAWRALGGG